MVYLMPSLLGLKRVVLAHLPLHCDCYYYHYHYDDDDDYYYYYYDVRLYQTWGLHVFRVGLGHQM